MGVFDKMLSVMNLDSEDEDFEDDEYDEYEDEEPRRKRGFFSHKDKGEEEETSLATSSVETHPARRSSKITPMRNARRNTSVVNNLEVCVIKPTQFDDSKEIVDTLLSGRLVIINIEGIDLSLAQRIVDVTSGACLAVHGTLQKISNFIFIVSPSGVDISGDLQGLKDAYDMSGIQTGFDT